MRMGRKLFGLFLVLVMLISIFAALVPDISISAASGLGTPEFTVKTIKSGTGVKLTISKTKGAKGYYIYISNTNNSYSKYMYDNGKYDHNVGYISKDGTKTRTFTINGLPKGKYSFKIMAFDEDLNMNYSKEKTVKIKSAKVKAAKEKKYDFSKARVGSIIKFGSYEQDDDMTNGKEDIEWIVLSKTKDQMFVVSKYVLDTLAYNKDCKEMTWQNCTLREWLNKSFYKTAFTEKERAMIKTTKIKNADNADYGTDGGKNTKDKVFLLSFDDIKNTGYGFNSDYFEADMARRCAPTAYAIAHGIYVAGATDEHAKTKDGESTCYWWLRSPGSAQDHACRVDEYGKANAYNGVGSGGIYVDVVNYGVRPAIIINLAS